MVMMAVVAAAVTARTLLRRMRCLMAVVVVCLMATPMPAAAAALFRLGLMSAVLAMFMCGGAVPVIALMVVVVFLGAMVMVPVAG